MKFGSWFSKGGEVKLNRVERLAAKRWVKERLVRMFPELRNDPQALEELYRGLSLEPRPGIGKGGAPVFVVVLPEKFEL